VRAELERRSIIIYTGQSRISADTITAVLDAYRHRDAGVLSALQHMRELAERMADTLAAGDIDALAELVGPQWTHQRASPSAIPTPRIDEIVARAYDAGAIGAKALGASGGGCVLLIARADRVEQVREAIDGLGEILPFKIAMDGVERCE